MFILQIGNTNKKNRENGFLKKKYTLYSDCYFGVYCSQFVCLTYSDW